MSTEDAKQMPNPKKRGLGRGLNALFEDDESAKPSNDASVGKAVKEEGGASKRQMMGIDQIVPNPDQPRGNFKQEPLAELTDSIRQHGVLQPLLVRKSQSGPGLYEIIAGERRWRASQDAQLHDVPVIVLDLDDEQAYQVAMIENLQRENLDPIEEAKGYQKLIDDYKYTQDKLAVAVGKSRPHVANILRLLSLPAEVQDMVVSQDLTMGHARALLGSNDPVGAAKQVVRQGLSVRQTEQMVGEQAGRKPQRKPLTGKSRKDADTLALEQDLANALGMRVSIDAKNGKGSIKIAFQDLDQLDEVIDRLRSSGSGARLRA